MGIMGSKDKERKIRSFLIVLSVDKSLWYCFLCKVTTFLLNNQTKGPSFFSAGHTMSYFLLKGNVVVPKLGFAVAELNSMKCTKPLYTLYI